MGFVVTTLSAEPDGVVDFCKRCRTGKPWAKERKYAGN
jgi:hypothetical protein